MYVSGENTALKCHFANKPCVLCQCTWQLEAPILPNYQGLSAKPTALGRIISLQELQTNHVTVFFFFNTRNHLSTVTILSAVWLVRLNQWIWGTGLFLGCLFRRKKKNLPCETGKVQFSDIHNLQTVSKTLVIMSSCLVKRAAARKPWSPLLQRIISKTLET